MTQSDFEHSVREHYGKRCSNCRCLDEGRCRVLLAVPVEAGGQRTITNAMFLCRTCEFNLGTVGREGRVGLPEKGQKVLLNFWVSSRLHEWVQAHTRFAGGSSMARHLMGVYTASAPERFNDLSFYQDSGTEVRLFVWADRTVYDAFKARASAQGLTVTDAIISLVLLYQSSCLESPT